MSPRRLKKTYRNPNPLFCQWLEEWRNEAKEKNSPMHHVYAKALKSLRKYPLKLETGLHCKVLENFGDKICCKLEEKLKHYDPNIQLEKSSSNKKMTGKRRALVDEKSKVKKAKTGYIPGYRSGAYALLLGLHELSSSKDFKGFVLKAELQKYAQKYCDTSFTHSDSGSHYTAWASMGTLLRKELVLKWSCPAKYKLSEKGADLVVHLMGEIGTSKTHSQFDRGSDSASPPAATIKVPNISEYKETSMSFQYVNSEGLAVSNKDQAHVEIKNNTVGFLALASPLWLKTSNIAYQPYTDRKSDDPNQIYIVICDQDAPQICPGLQQQHHIPTNDARCSKGEGAISSVKSVIPKLTDDVSEYKLILCIDCAEMGGNDNLTKQLDLQSIQYHIRKLSVGDFVWILQSKVDSSKEYVLPYIVERKRLDDLCGSIKDGRFREQKFRLKQCGISNCIYLIEKFDILTLPQATVEQSIVNTQVIDGFKVQFCQNKYETYKFLASLTNYLKRKVTDFIDHDELILFSKFSKDFRKTKKWSVKEMFAKHLMQCNSLTADKAKVITAAYPTPQHLLRKFVENGLNVADLIKYGEFEKIGSALTGTILKLYTDKHLK